MSFVETEASVRYETINGKRVPVITPKCEVTLTNTVTGQEYMSNQEAEDDINNANTATQKEHIRRDVNITVEEIKIGAGFNIEDWRMRKKLVNCEILAYLQVLRTCFNINNIKRNYGIFIRWFTTERSKEGF